MTGHFATHLMIRHFAGGKRRGNDNGAKGDHGECADKLHENNPPE